MTIRSWSRANPRSSSGAWHWPAKCTGKIARTRFPPDFGKRFCGMLGCHEAGVGIDIREQYRRRKAAPHWPLRGRCSLEQSPHHQGRSRRQGGEMKRGGAAAAGYGVAYTQLGGKCSLELLDHRPLREPIAAQHFDHSRDIIVINRVAPIGQYVVDGRGILVILFFHATALRVNGSAPGAEGLFAIRLLPEPGGSFLRRSYREHVRDRPASVKYLDPRRSTLQTYDNFPFVAVFVSGIQDSGDRLNRQK